MIDFVCAKRKEKLKNAGGGCVAMDANPSEGTLNNA
jgi:hypothetical protein